MTDDHPNLVIVFADQMRGSSMAFRGIEPVITPNLDRFAAESLVLPEAVSNFPVCSPYRAMLMTGKYPYANHVVGNCTSRTRPYNCELQAADRCWSDILKDRGYSLGYIGKWHLDSPHEPYVDCANNKGEPKWNEWCPPNRRHGFDFWYSYGTYDYHDRPMYWDTDADRDGFHFVDQWGPEHEADLAIEYLKNTGGKYRDDDKPFAMVVSMNPPHTPYHLVPDKYVEMNKALDIEALCEQPSVPEADTRWGDHYRQNILNYYSMITGVDDQFGRIMDAVDKTGLRDNTIVLFTADHGNSLGMHNRATKPNFYEECMPIPFLIRWPEEIAPRRDDLLLSAPDVYPTLIELLGFGDDIPASVEGTSFATLFSGGEQERPSSQLYLQPKFDTPQDGTRGVRTHRYTLVVTREDGNENIQLYDRREDPQQVFDCAGDRPHIVKDLLAEMYRWLEATGDPWV